MAEYELTAGDYKAASILISDFPKPNDRLRRRLELLKERIQLEQDQIASLRELGRNVDKSLGRKERSVIMACMGVIWTLLYFGLGWLTRAELLSMPHGVFMLVNGAYGIFLFIAMRIWREKLWETAVNRRFLWTLWAAFFAAAVFWPLAWYMKLAFGAAAAVTMLLYATVVWMSAAAVDRSLRWASIPYVLAAIGAALMPQYGWETMAIGTMGAMATASAVWRDPADQAGATGG